MFTVYALKSLSHNFIYVGMTENLEERLRRHNNGYNKSTKRFAPFELVYSEKCESGEAARTREKYFKTTSGKRFLRSLRTKKIMIIQSVILVKISFLNPFLYILSLEHLKLND
jgi:putative endonuclease